VLPNAAEALSLYFNDAPSMTRRCPTSPQFAPAADDLRDGAFLIAVPLIERTSRVVRANIRLDKGTLDAIDAAASARRPHPFGLPRRGGPPRDRGNATERDHPAAATGTLTTGFAADMQFVGQKHAMHPYRCGTPSRNGGE